MSIKKCLIVIGFIFMIMPNVFSQSKKDVDSIGNVIRRILDDAVVHDKIKDSTAVYGLTIVMDVALKGKRQFVEVTTNDATFSLGLDLTSLEKIKKIDFSPLMNNKKTAKFSFKVYFAVYDSKYSHNLKLEDVAKSIQPLILRNEFNVHNLGFKLTIFDKTVYH